MNVFSFSATQHMCVCLTYVASPGFCCLRVLRKEERDTDRSSFLINGSEVLEDLIFPIPALVHEYATIGVLNDEGGFGATESLTWKARLGKQLANALTYLHTAFPRPIILRDLNFSCIYLGHDYVPKLSYFGLSITIPPMKSYAEDEPKGRFGYSDPAHITSGIISEKGDVYSFGVLLLIFLTGQKAVVTNQDGEYESINSYVKFRTCNGQIQSFVDPKIFGEVGK
ncbi:putative protein kinase RLK-Pelle-RLCK-XII-2 family [Rosa chinensis]|uniref:Protein kinase domain-containing protein n=1 Tax=Rosa chinensis TaxID=74649 RepID=A0A2P6PK75_ROSCH|nr:putative protein kinase RLK-Pelle-RLCK-XII-2 family [Rosa chinensis]